MYKKLLLAASLTTILSACAMRTGPVTIYEQQEPLENVALISGYHEYVGENFPELLITEIDHKSSSDAMGYAVEAYVLPGNHKVKFRKINPSGLGWHSADVAIEAKAGHTYMTEYKIVKSPDTGKDMLTVKVLDKGEHHNTGMTYKK
ncbi:hypothetical protein LZP73_13110 [Shewanella sp. AS16]|uniref:hypothetical protein n=1 Tax=Shewanella sp. AS16 TaxID=2907625 RepID=UPI001F404DE9|nr:hypothetical protein [Shewanella sp. AS16]MCE9687131.1 hypothetical protein [Shewanella sp. AS16]